MDRFIKPLITIFSLITLFSLIPALWALSQGIWRTYTRADGLAGDSVYCINQDKFGNMWFGTIDAGLSKLDSSGVWTNFMNTDSTVSIIDIEIDSLNNKWLIIALNGGRLFGQYVGIFNDTAVVAFYDPSKGSMASPICLGQDSLGQIWCGMSLYGLACWFDGSQWHPYGVIGTGIYSAVNEIKTDRRGKLYFAHDWGLSTLTNVIIYLHSPVWDLAFDKQNRIWLATNLDRWGLMMFDGRNCYAHTTEEGLLSNYLMAVAVDSNNNVWVSYSSKRGVSKFDGAKFSHFNHNDGLADDLIYNIFVDTYGNIWFATLKGVSVLHDTTKTDVEFKKDFYPPKAFSLFYNYPNPFNMTTLIKYDLIFWSQIELIIYNLAGEEVIKLINEHQSPGAYQVVWDGKDKHGKEVNSGIYLAVLKCGNLKKSIKLSLIR